MIEPMDIIIDEYYHCIAFVNVRDCLL